MNYGFGDRRSASCGGNRNDPNELKAYLLSPFRQQGTSGSGRTGSGFFCVCQQDSFYLLNRRILRFSGRCAAGGKKEPLSTLAQRFLNKWWKIFCRDAILHNYRQQIFRYCIKDQQYVCNGFRQVDLFVVAGVCGSNVPEGRESNFLKCVFLFIS